MRKHCFICACTFFIPVAASATAPACGQPVAQHHWNFNEGAGVQAESVDSHVRAELFGGVGWAFGPEAVENAGTALWFDGLDDIVRIDPLPFSPSGDFTVSLWLQSNKRRNAVIASHMDVFQRRPLGWSLSIREDGGLNMVVAGDHDVLTVDVPASLTDGSWHAVTVAVSADADFRASASMFVDGRFVGASFPVLLGKARAVAPLQLGAATAGPKFSGVLDDVRLYARALTLAEIEQLHHRCIAQDGYSPPLRSSTLQVPPQSSPLNISHAVSSNRVGGGHHGNQLDVMQAATSFVVDSWTGALLRRKDDPRICALRRRLGPNPQAALLESIAASAAQRMGESKSAVHSLLTDPSQCSSAPQQTHLQLQSLIPFPVNARGVPVSTNRTWNRCIATPNAVGLPMIRQNTDVIASNARGTLVRQKTCGDYVRREHHWRHPDFPELDSFFFRHSPYQLQLPAGFVAKTNVLP